MKNLILTAVILSSGLSALAQQATGLQAEYGSRMATLRAQEEERERQRIDEMVERSRLAGIARLQRLEQKALAALRNELGKEPLETNVVSNDTQGLVLYSRNTDGTVCQIVAIAGTTGEQFDQVYTSGSRVCL